MKGGGGGGGKNGVGWAHTTKQLDGFANDRALEHTALRKNMARKYGDKCFGASEISICNKVKTRTKMIYIGYTQISEKLNESKDISHSSSNVPPCGIRKKKWENDNRAF